MSWQPIETVPQGVMVLLADMTADEAKRWAYVGWRHSSNREGHCETTESLNRPATHWQPLPAPPESP